MFEKWRIATWADEPRSNAGTRMKTPRGSVTADDASMTSEASMSLTSEASVASAADEV